MNIRRCKICKNWPPYHPVLIRDTIDSGLSSTWPAPFPPPEPPSYLEQPPPPWCPPSIFSLTFDSGFQQRPTLHLPLGAQLANHHNSGIANAGSSSAWRIRLPVPKPPPPWCPPLIFPPAFDGSFQQRPVPHLLLGEQLVHHPVRFHSTWSWSSVTSLWSLPPSSWVPTFLEEGLPGQNLSMNQSFFVEWGCFWINSLSKYVS